MAIISVGSQQPNSGLNSIQETFFRSMMASQQMKLQREQLEIEQDAQKLKEAQFKQEMLEFQAKRDIAAQAKEKQDAEFAAIIAAGEGGFPSIFGKEQPNLNVDQSLQQRVVPAASNLVNDPQSGTRAAQILALQELGVTQGAEKLGLAAAADVERPAALSRQEAAFKKAFRQFDPKGEILSDEDISAAAQLAIQDPQAFAALYEERFRALAEQRPSEATRLSLSILGKQDIAAGQEIVFNDLRIKSETRKLIDAGDVQAIGATLAGLGVPDPEQFLQAVGPQAARNFITQQQLGRMDDFKDFALSVMFIEDINGVIQPSGISLEKAAALYAPIGRVPVTAMDQLEAIVNGAKLAPGFKELSRDEQLAEFQSIIDDLIPDALIQGRTGDTFKFRQKLARQALATYRKGFKVSTPDRAVALQAGGAVGLLFHPSSPMAKFFEFSSQALVAGFGAEREAGL